MTDLDDADDLLRGLARGQLPDKATLARFVASVGRSARAAGGAAVLTGRWLSDVVLELAPRVPIRDRATLRDHYRGLDGAALAGELVRTATRASAGVGAATGAVVSAGTMAPPTWVAIPFELAAETIVIALIEMKLIAELHEVYDHPVTGEPGSRATALVRAWAERRGVSPEVLARPGGLSNALGRGSRNELARLVRRRLAGRMGRNLSSLAPLLTGAIAGAEINRRATRSLGEAVVRDLADRATTASPDRLALPPAPPDPPALPPGHV